MVLELKSGFQSLAFKVQIMNHSLGDLVTGLGVGGRGGVTYLGQGFPGE